jgi:hypothetical protein
MPSRDQGGKAAGKHDPRRTRQRVASAPSIDRPPSRANVTGDEVQQCRPGRIAWPPARPRRSTQSGVLPEHDRVRHSRDALYSGNVVVHVGWIELGCAGPRFESLNDHAVKWVVETLVSEYWRPWRWQITKEQMKPREHVLTVGEDPPGRCAQDLVGSSRPGDVVIEMCHRDPVDMQVRAPVYMFRELTWIPALSGQELTGCDKALPREYPGHRQCASVVVVLLVPGVVRRLLSEMRVDNADKCTADPDSVWVLAGDSLVIPGHADHNALMTIPFRTPPQAPFD